MNINIIKKIFKELSFSEIETKVYLEALKPENNSIMSIAKRLGVERPTVYAAIERLKSNGLVAKTKKPYTRGIEVEPPAKVLTKLKKKISDTVNLSTSFEQVLPDLMSTFHARGKYQKVMFYETKEDFLCVFDQILEETKEGGLFFGDADSFINFIGVDFEKDWIKRRVKRGLSIRILVFYSNLLAGFTKHDKKELRETKFLPKQHRFKTSFQVYGYKTILWNPVIPRVTVIDDPIYARMFRNIFEIVWERV